MITLIAFILILSLLILIHEFGHYFSAKKLGVMVEEFGMGIPPKLWGKKLGETEYSINALPFGGFVRLYGEDVEEPAAEMKTDPRSFLAKPPWQRAIIIVAGVAMNLVLAITMYYLLFFFTGFKSLNVPVFFNYHFKFGDVHEINTVVTSFAQDSPAREAGIELGEAVMTIDGVPVYNVQDIRDEVQGKPGEEVSLVVRDLKRHTKDASRGVALVTDTDEEGHGILGIYVSNSAQIYYPNKLLAPFQHSYNMLAYTGFTFKQFVKISLETKSVEPVSSGVAGPVGIYSVVEGILGYGGMDAFLGLVDFIALLSLSLALINILPLPALDGGRLLFIAYEVIFKKPLNQKVETTIHRWGMIFFFGLLILVTIKDIRQFLPF
jgi:regulator of sigma E protease